MSDHEPNNELVPSQNDPEDMNELFEDEEDLNPGFDIPNTSSSPSGDSVTTEGREAVTLAILPSDDSVSAQQELGVENHREVAPDQTARHEDAHQSVEDIHQSVEDDLVPGTQPVDRIDFDLEPEQQAQQTSQELINHDTAMEDDPNESENTALASTVHAQHRYTPPLAELAVQHDVDMQDSSSLFVPERRSPSRSATAVPLTPHMDLVPPQQPATPVRQPDTLPKLSVFDKIRTLRKIVQARKNAVKNAAAYQPNADLDPEVYLEAVTSKHTRPAGTTPVDEDEMAHMLALAEFRRQKLHYDQIKAQHNGRLPFRQDVEWMKIKGAEDARLKKRQRELVAAQEGAEQDLFPPVRIEREEQDDDSDTGYYVETSSRKRRRGGQPSKHSDSTSFQDAEYQSMLVALDANNDNAKKKKVAAGSAPGNNSRASTKGKAPKSKAAGLSRSKAAGKSSAKGPRRTAKDKRELERATKQATSLFNANVFEQQAGMGAADQPVFKHRNKAEALKELIASVPTPDKSRARNDMNSLLQASKDFDGRLACTIAENGNWLVRGMSTSLKGYQVLGSAFMRRRENDANEPKGGLMADQMGLGKTLMMLANIVNSRDAMIRTKERGPKTTLLVASPALLAQWASEIEQHTNCGMTVMRYGAGNRIDSTNATQVLESHDIILTTYGEVMKSYPKHIPPIECQTAEEKLAWWKEVWQSHRGVLHQIHFKRIVLDEAQAIKNHQSRTSIACRALIASHKWALSGTPILNGLDELYPYFKFLGVPHTGSFKIFKQNYCGSGSGESAERLLVRLSQFMIRRTHADRMFNAPILKLPQANQITHWCEFNSVERSIYNIVHQRFAMNINMLSKKGTLTKSYNNVLVMLLRLRQLSAHVLMLQFVMRDLLEREDIEKIKEVVAKQASASSVNQSRTILAIRKQLEAHELCEKRKTAAKAKRKLAAEEAAKAAEKAGQEYVEPSDDDNEVEENDEPVGLPRDGDGDGDGDVGEGIGLHYGVERNKSGKGFGKGYNFKPYVNSLAIGDAWEKKKEEAKCGQCARQHLTNPWLTTCGHLICDPCYEEVMGTAAEAGQEHATCKTCGSTFTECLPCDEADDIAGPGRSTRLRAAQKKKSQEARMHGEEINDDWLTLGGDDVLPSAKTVAVKAQILNWIRGNPNVKIIVYTQFLAMIRILAKACQMETWATEQYHGKQSLGARGKAIKNFADNPNVKVLLASLRCGGLGLNLTMASKVIIIDPWWNQASEQQAFCRVFRIGQQDETSMTRMCVRNTVDERLIEMQKEKQKEIDEVMEDGGRKTKNLDIADLMRLFGNIEEAEDGRPFIVVDNPTAPGGFFADQDHEGYADDV